jgi:hypothetical protein
LIRGGEISFGDLQVNLRLALGQIFGLDDLAGLVFVGRLQTGAFACQGIHAIKYSTANAAMS